METKNKIDSKGMIIDMDGVLWRGPEIIANLKHLVQTFNSSNIKFLFLTNNSTRHPRYYVEKFASNGANIDESQVLTSAQATARYLKKHFPQVAKVFVVGESGLEEAMTSDGYVVTNTDPEVVVVGMDRDITYNKLTQATLFIRKGVPFIGTNSDRTFPLPEGFAPGAGAILALLEAATDVHPIIIGKPNPEIYRLAASILNLHPSQILAVGDRLETDIVGGQEAGCKTALVLSGVSTLEQGLAHQPLPDMIVDHISLLFENWNKL